MYGESNRTFFGTNCVEVGEAKDILDYFDSWIFTRMAGKSKKEEIFWGIPYSLFKIFRRGNGE